MRRKYAAQSVRPVENDFEQLEDMGLKVVTGDLVGDAKLVRHDPRVAAQIVVDLAKRARARNRKRQMIVKRQKDSQ